MRDPYAVFDNAESYAGGQAEEIMGKVRRCTFAMGPPTNNGLAHVCISTGNLVHGVVTAECLLIAKAGHGLSCGCCYPTASQVLESAARLPVARRITTSPFRRLVFMVTPTGLDCGWLYIWFWDDMATDAAGDPTRFKGRTLAAIGSCHLHKDLLGQ